MGSTPLNHYHSPCACPYGPQTAGVVVGCPRNGRWLTSLIRCGGSAGARWARPGCACAVARATPKGSRICGRSGKALDSLGALNYTKSMTNTKSTTNTKPGTPERVWPEGSKTQPIEVWLSQKRLKVTCTIVYEDEGTDEVDVDSLSMRGAQREVTGWLIKQGYTPAGRWDAESSAMVQGDGEFDPEMTELEVVRAFKPTRDKAI